MLIEKFEVFKKKKKKIVFISTVYDRILRLYDGRNSYKHLNRIMQIFKNFSIPTQFNNRVQNAKRMR